MKHLVSCCLLLVLAFGVTGQHPRSTSPLVNMVRAEQAFSQASRDLGTLEAFMQFIADDGILFRPKAVLGKQWMQDHPPPPSNKRPLLAWQPVFAAVSAAGDMGYTTGPWEFKSDINDPTPAGFGQFITVWKKQVDGAWKFVIDLGISHPESAGPLKIWQVSDSKSRARPPLISSDAAEKAMQVREAEFTDIATREMPLVAFTRFGAGDIRLFRDGNFPFIGKQRTTRFLTAHNEMNVWTLAGGDVATSGDLGYVYGTYQTRTSDQSQTNAVDGNFLRIWQKRGNDWLIVLDVASPLQQ